MITISNLQINVEISGEKSNSVILLHGWGQNTNVFRDVCHHLSTTFTVYNIDLPGFGLSDKPSYPFNTKDYADIIKGIIDYYKIDNPILIGHSFGGRVAIKYTSLYNSVRKLVLVDSAGIVNRKKFKYYLKVYTYKFLKKTFSFPLLRKYKQKVLKHFGSTDYKNADDIMRKVLVTVVNEDLRLDLKEITCPTLLVWGTEDYTTPIEDAYIMLDHLKDSGIAKIENAGHFSYLNNLPLFLTVLDEFFKDDQ